MTKSSSNAETTSREITIERVFDAPRELVWKAWTEPDRLMRWWGPANFTSPNCRIDLRVGGSYLFCMRSPEGKDYWSSGVYREIIPLERLVYSDSFADENGNRVPPSYYEMPGDWPPELLVTVTFEEDKGKTKVTMQHTGIPGAMNEMANAGWNQSLDKLAESLK